MGKIIFAAHLLVLLGELCLLSAQEDILSEIKRCSRNEPDYDDCLKESVKGLLSALFDGIPRLNISTLDPIIEPESTINYRRGPIQLTIQKRNSYFYGLRNIEIKNVKVELDDSLNLHVEVGMRLPRAYLAGEYKVNGAAVLVPIYGKGRLNMTMIDVTGTMSADGKPVKRDGKTYIQFKSFRISPAMKSTRLTLSGIYGNNNFLNGAAVAFVNQFWDFFYRELLSEIQEDIDILLTDYANTVALKAPIDTFISRK